MPLIALTKEQGARVRSSIAPLQGDAKVSAPQVSQLLSGHVVQLLESNGDWWRVRGEDEYEGWVHTGYLEPSSGSEASWRVTTGALLRMPDGTLRRVPLGARIPPSADVLEGDAWDPAELPVEFPRDGARVAQSASRRFAGASYQWGGVTPWGCDCSGLVQNIFTLHGVRLPRDAWQQAMCGDAVATAPDAWHAGDLLFFSDREDRRVTHVGVALAAGSMVHSGLRRGGVKVETVERDDGWFAHLIANMTGARRVI